MRYRHRQGSRAKRIALARVPVLWRKFFPIFVVASSAMSNSNFHSNVTATGRSRAETGEPSDATGGYGITNGLGSSGVSLRLSRGDASVDVVDLAHSVDWYGDRLHSRLDLQR